jgi:hypothetical protein
MLDFDAPTIAARAASSLITRRAFTFDFPSGIYGFWDGTAPLTIPAIPSVTFRAGGQLIEIETAEQSLAMDATSVKLRLTSHPETALTSTVLQTIESENYHMRPVTIYRLLFNVDTRAFISHEVRWRGYVDKIEHERSGSNYAIVGHLESRSIDYTKRGTAVASNAEQQLVSAGDIGLEFAGVIARLSVPFGTRKSKDFEPEYVRRPVL